MCKHSNNSSNTACDNYDSNGWDGTCLNCGQPRIMHDDNYRTLQHAVRTGWHHSTECVARIRPLCMN